MSAVSCKKNPTMKISAAVVLAMLFIAEPLAAQRLPRVRSRLAAAEVEVTSEAAETLKTKVKAKSEPKAAVTASPSSTSTPSPSSSPPPSDASPPSPSPSPSPPTPSVSTNPSVTPSTKSNGDSSNSTREASKSPPSSTTPEPISSSTSSTASSSVAPPISSVQVRMSFSPAGLVSSQINKKLQEERGAKSVSADDEAKSEGVSAKPKKISDAQETTKKPSSTAASSPTSTSTAKPTTLKPLTSKATSTSKPDQEEEVGIRDALKRIHQEVLKQPRGLEAKTKSGDTKSTNSTSTPKKPPKETPRPGGENSGLDTAETAYVRPTAVHLLHDGDTSHLDAQASIQNAKFVLRDQGLQQLPSFVRSKDRLRSSSPNTVRTFLLQKQPLIIQQQQQLQHQQRQQPRTPQLNDPIDEEAITSTTSTTAYPIIPIVHFDKEQSADGSYKTSYETANNIFAEETGFLKNPGVEDQEALVQQGSYSYTAPDGSLISVTYTADEMGFRAAGTHLPTPPPVPPEIQRSLDIIYAQIQRDEEEAAREAEFERQEEASETHEERLDPPTTGSKRESRRYLP